MFRTITNKRQLSALLWVFSSHPLSALLSGRLILRLDTSPQHAVLTDQHEKDLRLCRIVVDAIKALRHQPPKTWIPLLLKKSYIVTSIFSTTGTIQRSSIYLQVHHDVSPSGRDSITQPRLIQPSQTVELLIAQARFLHLAYRVM
ncbi:hypothetical protein PROFUN_10743 [Planoprotostelium fungivorum]|uniref:Uncharacterized protein n=1 Tax=Planoprotostelium fungivorum TaxID=1890364 RepID=A0A2P6N7Y3_9EUKA|nr:hypothetical protein PROFUN_10743 [Planoprotostelium fungivorum]